MMSSHHHIPMDKTRRKRLKVVSACSECRRKKTKCNGETPCIGCIKTRVDCRYSNGNKPKPSVPRHDESLAPKTTATPTVPKSATAVHGMTTTTESIEAIESRLSVIEDVLRALIRDSKKTQHGQSSYGQSRSFFGSLERDLAYIHSGDMYHPVHAAHAQNRQLPREKRQRHEHFPMTPPPDSSLRLPPLHHRAHPSAPTPPASAPAPAAAAIPPPPSSSSSSAVTATTSQVVDRPTPLQLQQPYQQPSLSTSSSSSSSASSSSSSPKTASTIRSLLNDEDFDEKVTLPPVSALTHPAAPKSFPPSYNDPRSFPGDPSINSAFYRLAAPSRT
ncbi:uncharacterized protein BYT42DRAFT_580199 [Radiomyces spectabilis]|uniref:uncharacterized protein n=1 Tax=Radiomyces spectabilis TaxID=64574 RepID=UPI002220C082|nr:uncharacterized protein BYT42DRAFT_580199 [Radiomyces spectabilis]KAI8371426.1 hypothetical protein BYT42DRAFT_580199 [Radiomyces spectabilis]